MLKNSVDLHERRRVVMFAAAFAGGLCSMMFFSKHVFCGEADLSGSATLVKKA